MWSRVCRVCRVVSWSDLLQGHKLHTKEAQRKDLFVARLQMEIDDSTKVTTELARRKMEGTSSKVDSNFNKEET